MTLYVFFIYMYLSSSSYLLFKSLKQCKTHLYLHMYPDKENTFIFHIRVPTMIMDEHTAISDAIMYRVWKKTVYIEVSRHNS